MLYGIFKDWLHRKRRPLLRSFEDDGIGDSGHVAALRYLAVSLADGHYIGFILG